MKMMKGANRWRRQVPFILLTNGGGVTEEAKAHELSRELGVKIMPNQVVLSHSPMQSLVDKYRHRHVLVIGGAERRCAEVAQHYGFEKVTIPDDIVAWNPSAWPFTSVRDYARPEYNYSQEPIDAMMVLHDSRDWARDLQIMTDVLQSRHRVVGRADWGQPAQIVPVYFSNPDFQWSNEYPTPRFAQGAFRLTLELLHRQLTGGNELKYRLFGKPHTATYEFALTTLDDQARVLDPAHTGFRRFYAVGDNPESDIMGANNHGWHSIAVRTGIFQHPDQVAHRAELQPKDIVEDVEEAVNLILEKELAM
ncbi:hypothetical protein IWQ60_003751 [Tieghemiomyces parasiticus]|uniref:Uncharacterized protein n=1 Tax=Tieghemiomyces parasiticus TaxID=78921 RepID=A0A9W8DUI0_9FUNG|nr:hypothetical protein IWQ60_003751 [Tieghemiomyces parasiticus]